MAYLNTQWSKQESGVVVDSYAVETEQTASGVNEATAHTEQGNFKIARQLKDEQSRLSNALSQFPVTALWLLNKYEQNACMTEQYDETTLASELTTALAEIKKHFHVLSGTVLTETCYALEKQNLATALQLFPFSFHDLIKLVDVVVYAYKFRGLCYQPAIQAHENNANLMLKRLEGLSRRSSIDAALWLGSVSSYDEYSLFLSPGDMHKYVAEAVFSEHRWLGLRQKLATVNSRLVLFIANQYKSGFLDFDDLVQEGQSGLLKAVDRYDHRLGFQFSTYAGYWIRQAISRSLSRCERVVRVPCGQVATINKVFRIKEQFIARTGEEPTIKELAECATLSSDEIHAVLSISQTALSLEGYDEDEESSFAPIDFLEQQVFTPSFIKIAQTDLENLMGKAIKILNPREAKVICCHFGVEVDREMTLQEIGAELNLTRERVRQIQVIALDKIKRSFGEQLMSFL